MIGIICAMDTEAQEIINEMKNVNTERISGIDYKSGTYCNHKVVVAVCGVGKVFAAICTQTMILNYSPRMIFNIGVAGSLSNKLHIADTVIATSVVQYDLDTTAVGDTLGMVSGINKINFKCDKNIADELLKIAAEKLQTACVGGVIASGDRFITAVNDKKFLSRWFGALACDMESGAVGQVCYVNGLPFCIIRSLSDMANESSSYDYNKFLNIASKNSVLIVKSYLAQLDSSSQFNGC